MAFREKAAEADRLSSNLVGVVQPRFPSSAIGGVVAAIEGGLVLLGSLGGDAAYDLATGKDSGAREASFGLGLVAALVYVYFAYSTHLYRLSVLVDPARNLRRIARTCIISLVSLTTLTFLLKISSVLSRGASILFALLVIILCVVARLVLAASIRALVDNGIVSGKPVLVLGEPSELSRLPPGYLLHHFGLSEIGRFPLEPANPSGSDLIRPESIRQALALSRTSNATAFLIVARWDSTARLTQIERETQRSPLRVLLLPNHVFRAAMSRSTANDDIAGRLVELQRAPMSLLDRGAKRALDLAVASFAILAISPILLGTALAVRIDSKGPSIFRQRRNGFNQKPFMIYKFRTMTVLEDGTSIAQAKRDDSRITRVGRFLRRSSIDELPQLFNVIKGNMSLVGPRPHALAHDNQYTELIDDYCMRHHVKPGITGWAQVNGYRGETARQEQMQRRVDLDVWYINNRSLLLDLRILLRTCVEVLKHDAY